MRKNLLYPLLLASCVLVFVSCSKEVEMKPKEPVVILAKTVIQSGDYIRLSYTGSLKDGTVFDSTHKPGRTPILFQTGKSPLFEKVNKELFGMYIGETKKVTVEPSDGYGEKYTPFEYTKEIFGDKKIKEGELIDLAGTKVKILKIKDITVDVGVPNTNPLAGESLYYEITIEDIQKSPSVR